MIENYGQLTLQQVRTHVLTYINLEDRQAQNSFQIYSCLMSSLTKEAKDTVLLSEEDYTVDGTSSGVALLKVIVRETSLDTNATTRFIRDSLSNLDSYMEDIDSDIKKFNEYVKTQVEALSARGQTTNDLLSNLFKGYAAASDSKFRKYIAKKEEDYDDGEALTEKQLMQLALNKFKNLVRAGKWKAPDDQEAKIIALEAKIAKMQKSRAPKQPDNTKKTNSNSKGTQSRGTQRPEKPKWMLVAPKSGEKTTKTVDGNQYWWCPHHKSWGKHTEQACRVGQKKKAESDKPESKSPTKDAATEPTLQLSKGLIAIAEADDEES